MHINADLSVEPCRVLNTRSINPRRVHPVFLTVQMLACSVVDETYLDGPVLPKKKNAESMLQLFMALFKHKMVEFCSEQSVDEWHQKLFYTDKIVFN